jgi:membrane protein
MSPAPSGSAPLLPGPPKRQTARIPCSREGVASEVTVRARWDSFKGIVGLWVDLFERDDLLTVASAIAMQALIAAISLLLLGLGMLGAVGDTKLWTRTIGPAISGRVLPEVFLGINEVVHKVFATSSGGLIAFAAALAIWEVSGVVRASMGALNDVYEIEESRPWWIRFPLSFGLSVVLIVSWLGAIVLIAAVNAQGAWGYPLAILRWVAAIGLLIVGFGLLVRWAPCRHRAKKWVSAGAVLVVVAWIVETLIFRWYVGSVADFKTTVGSFAVFIVVTTYLYVGSIILLVGMELDELVRHDLEQPKSRRVLLPLVDGVLRG